MSREMRIVAYFANAGAIAFLVYELYSGASLDPWWAYALAMGAVPLLSIVAFRLEALEEIEREKRRRAEERRKRIQEVDSQIEAPVPPPRGPQRPDSLPDRRTRPDRRRDDRDLGPPPGVPERRRIPDRRQRYYRGRPDRRRNPERRRGSTARTRRDRRGRRPVKRGAVSTFHLPIRKRKL